MPGEGALAASEQHLGLLIQIDRKNKQFKWRDEIVRLSFFCKKGLHENLHYSNILLARGKETKTSESPKRRKIWLVGQEAKTLPSHGRIMGSIPVRATKDLHLRCRSFIYSLIYITYLSNIMIRFCGALF